MKPLEQRQFDARVVSGGGSASALTRLPWVRETLRWALGLDPFPGTLNLRSIGAARLPARPAVRLVPPDRAQLAAQIFAVRVSGRSGPQMPAAIIRPEGADYPEDLLEVVCPLPLRDTLLLADGDTLRLALTPDQQRFAGLIFDVDGTLVDSLEGYRVAAEYAAAPLGLEVTREAIRQVLNTDRSLWELLADKNRLRSGLDAAALDARARSHWPEVLAHHVRLFPGVGQLLHALRGAGLKLAICTCSHGETLPVLERSGLAGLFETVVTAHDVVRRKPHPEGLLHCLDRLGLPAAQVAYVGDTPLDIQAARAVGVHAIGVLSGAGDSAQLAAAGADRLVADVSGLEALCLGVGRTRD